MDQEKIMQLQVIEQEINQLNQQLQLIEQNISEVESLGMSLNEIEKNNDNEMLISIGKGIYIPVEIKDKNLIVEVGGKNFIKKNIPDTIKIIEDQLGKLINTRESIKEKLEELQAEINEAIKIIQEEKNKKN